MAKAELAETDRATKEVKPKKGIKVVSVLDKKKTMKDAKGDEWEVVDKRDKKLIEKPIETDSDAGSELSYD